MAYALGAEVGEVKLRQASAVVTEIQQAVAARELPAARERRHERNGPALRAPDLDPVRLRLDLEDVCAGDQIRRDDALNQRHQPSPPQRAAILPT